MIRLIAAIDSLRGIADNSGIPWSLPSDSAYYKKKVSEGGKIVMGYQTYLNHSSTITRRPEYVLTSHTDPLRAGFISITSIDTFLNQNSAVWVIGGQGVFEAALPYADELYITQVDGDFNCTKFFPSFGEQFQQVSRSKIKQENGILFQYQVWRNVKHLASLSDTE